MTDSNRPYSTAKGFAQGAFAMMANPLRFQTPDDTTFILSFHHLIGFSVELYLKAFLMEKGMKETKLMYKPYGHSLQNLLAAAKEKEFSCSEGDSLVEYLKPHETYDYRYIKNETEYKLQRIDYIFKCLSALDRYVDATTGASASHGKEIGRGWVMPKEAAHWRII